MSKSTFRKYDDDYILRYRNLPAASYCFDASYNYAAYINRTWAKDMFGNITFVKMHNHAEYEILYVVNGQGLIKLNTLEPYITVKKGDLVLLNPYDVHAGAFAPDQIGFSHMCIDFSISLLENNCSSYSKNLSSGLSDETIKFENIIPADDPLNEQLVKYFKSMKVALDSENCQELEFIGSLFCFFSLLTQNKRFLVAQNQQIKKNNTFIREVIKYVDEHLSEQISTDDIAENLSYNKEHFCRLFKKHFSTNFSRYLALYRISKAKSYLLANSVTATAALLGFNNPSYFAKIFKEIIGISPSEYIKLAKEQMKGIYNG